MANGWTPERRARQAAMIRTWKPWERSTGPRTIDGKARVARNYLNAPRHLVKGLLPAFQAAALLGSLDTLLELSRLVVRSTTDGGCGEHVSPFRNSGAVSEHPQRRR